MTSTMRSERSRMSSNVAAAAGQDADELGPQPGHRGDLVRALLEQRRERAADGAVAEQPDPERLRVRHRGR